MKVVADAKYNEILGAHLIGPDVTELLPVLTLAQQWDLTADEVGRTSSPTRRCPRPSRKPSTASPVT